MGIKDVKARLPYTLINMFELEKVVVDAANLMFLAPYSWRGQAIPTEKKNFLSTGPETRRKRSVCSRASKCTTCIERVSR